MNWEHLAADGRRQHAHSRYIEISVSAPLKSLSRQAPLRRRRRPAAGHVRRAPRRRATWRLRLILASCAIAVVCVAWAAIARAWAPTGNTSATRFDAIIVLGGNVDRDGNPSPDMLARITEGVNEYERGVAPHIILTGGPQHGFVEARIMARAAEAEGIPASSLVLEPEAGNTIQNACFSARIMRQRGWRSAEVVTTAAHLPRAGIIFSGAPIQWRTHEAPALQPVSTLVADGRAASEVFHTLYFLVFSRWAERCSP